MVGKSRRIQIDIETRARLAAFNATQAEIRDLTKNIEETTLASVQLKQAGGTLQGAFRMGGAIAGFNLLFSSYETAGFLGVSSLSFLGRDREGG